MPVDRGGIDYRIETSGDFRALNKFKKDLVDVQGRLKAVKAQQRSLGGGSSKKPPSAQKQVTTAKKLTNIQKRQEAIAKKIALLNSRTLQKSELRLKRMTAIRREEEKSILLKDKSLAKRRKELSVEKSIARFKEKQAKFAKLASFARSQGLKGDAQKLADLGLSKGRAQQFGLLEATKKLTDIEKRRAAIVRNLAALQDKELAKKRQELSVEQAITRFKEKQARFAKLAAFAKTKGLGGNAQALSDLGFSKGRAQQFGLLESPETPGRLDRLKTKLSGLQTISDRAVASIQRMFTALVFFTLARKIVDFIKDMVTGMVQFNSRLEQVRLGMAALLVATGLVVNAQGKVVDGAEAISIAQKEATKQTSLLRKESLRTAATFETLAETFQVAIAPGRQAGLAVDEIRKFTVLISQAASAIGLPQNQLAEEIRSLLQGTIQARTTRIATSLGITNEDIKRVKEAGVLFDFLMDRFSAFGAAGEQVLNTFEAIRTNLIDAFRLAAGEGGFGFFEALKATLKDLIDELVIVDKITGEIRPSPEAVKAFANFGDTLKGVVNLFKEALVGNQLGVLQSTLTIVSGLVKVISGFVLGITDAMKPIVSALSLFGALPISAAARLFGQMTVAFLAAKLVPWKTLLIALKFLGKFSFKILFAAINGLVIKVQLLGVAFLSAGIKAQLMLGAIGVALIAATVLVAKLTSEFSGLRGEMEEARGEPVSFGDTVLLVVGQIITSIKKFWVTVKTVFKQGVGGLKLLWFEFASFIFTSISETAIKIVDIIFGLAKKFPAIAKLFKKLGFGDIDLIESTLKKGFSGAADFAKKKAGEVRKEIKKIGEQAVLEKAKIEELATKISAGIIQPKAPTRTKRTAGQERQIDESLSDLIGAGGGAIVGRPVLRMAEDTQVFAKNMRSARAELDLVRANLTGQPLAEFKAVSKSRLAIAKQIKEIEKESETRRQANIQRAATIAKEVRSLNEKELSFAKKLIEATKKRADLNRDLLKMQNKVAELRLTGKAVDSDMAASIEKQNLSILEQESTIKRIATESSHLFKIQKKIVDSSAKIVKAQLEIKADTEALKQLDETRLGISEKSDKLLEVRLKKIREEFELKTQITRLELSQQAAALTLEREVLAGRVSKEEQNLFLASQRLELEKRRLETMILQDGVLDEALAKQIQLVEVSAAQAERLRIIAEGGIAAVGLGLIEGFRSSIEQLPGMYQAAFNIAQQGLTSFANTISSTIMDALDPNKSGKDIKDKWKKFAKDLAANILKQTILTELRGIFDSLGEGPKDKKAQNSSLIVSLLSSIFGSSSGNARGGLVPGFADGGEVGNAAAASAAGSTAHLSRPSGLDSRDTVPAFLRPGEFVIRPEAVNAFGSNFFAALNKGINPMALLPGLAAASGVRANVIRGGAAMGGIVSQNSGVQQAPPQQIITPVIVVDESMAETFFAAAPGAFKNALRDHQTTTRTSERDRGQRF